MSVVLSATFYGCKTNTDDLWDSIHQLDGRVTSLENLCRQVNGNITTLQALVKALQDNVSITKVTPLTEEGQTVGYIINFSKGSPITIYHGTKGDKSDKGDSGTIPQIGVKIDTDGIYYWTLNGDWLTDELGERIKAVGKDGVPGKDAITPQLKIEEGRWMMSTDDGISWADLGQATGDKGNSLFQDITVDDENNQAIFTLTDGTIIKLPLIVSDMSTYPLIVTFKTIHVNQTIQVARDVEGYPVAGLENRLQIIDYGDGTKGTSSTHTYAAAGEYTVTFALENEVTEIGESAFRDCMQLIDVEYTERITQIGDFAFYNTGLVSIIIPNTITRIGVSAFSSCKNVEKISIPNSVVSLGTRSFSYKTTGELFIDCDMPSTDGFGTNSVFYCSNISKVTIGKNVSSIGDWEFYSCNKIQSIEYEENSNLKNIGYAAFQCSLVEEMPIPASVQTIGEYAFALCNNLKAFKMVGSSMNGNYTVWDDVLWYRIMPHVLLRYPPKKEGDTYEIERTKYCCGIAKGAFRDCINLRKIILPDYYISPMSLGAGTFMDCINLSVVDNFEHTEAVSLENTFRGCESLTSIQLPETLEEINYSTFQNCTNLLQVKIPESVKIIGESAFDGCMRLTGNLVISDNVETIGPRAFNGCIGFNGNLVIGRNVKSIGYGAFRSVKIENNGGDSYEQMMPLNFSKIYCYGSIPPSSEGKYDYINEIFGGIRLPYLGVLKGYKDVYEKNGWDFFETIEEL